MKFSFKHKIRSMLIVTSGGLLSFTAVNIYTQNEKFYNNWLMPVIHWCDPEMSHKIAVAAAKYKLLAPSKYKDPTSLKTRVWNLDFKNPIGIAAGFDKHGEAVEALGRVGFGFVEIGSVTPEPQLGNEKPRVFRLQEDQAIINRYGFNSDGHDVVYSRLQSLKESGKFSGVVGVNLGANKTSSDPVRDYVEGVKKFGDVADYLVINVSSPNTAGLRDWQKQQNLEELLTRVISARDSLEVSKKPPLLLKLAPDLTEKERRDIASIITKEKCHVDGLIISNTTIARPPSLQSANQREKGGLSGAPLRHISTHLIAEMSQLTQGKIPIIGVGGVFSGKDAYEKIKAGASLVQLYTAFTYHGPPIVARIKRELDELLSADEVESVSAMVGNKEPLRSASNTSKVALDSSTPKTIHSGEGIPVVNVV